MVDVSGSEGRDPVADFEAIQAELKEYGSGLENRPMLVAGNKVDIAADRSALEALRAHVEGLGLPFYEISAAAQQGTRELMYAAARELEHLPPITVYEPTYVERPPEVDTSEPLDITPRGRHLAGGGPLAPAAHGQRQLRRLRVPKLV